MNPGATASTRAIDAVGVRVELARASASPPTSCGTHCVNIDITCLPSGASVGSNTDGMQMSANGSAAARPATASWNARFDVVERVGEHDRAAVHLGIEAGLGGELGEPVDARRSPSRCRCASSSVRSRRRSRRAASARSIWSRNVIFGCVAAITTSARSSSPIRERDAGARGRCARRCAATRRVGAHASRRTTRAARAQRVADRAHAADREAPRRRACPSPTSPILWCAITYAVPGERGPGPRADHAADRRARPASAATRTTRRAGRRCSS